MRRDEELGRIKVVVYVASDRQVPHDARTRVAAPDKARSAVRPGPDGGRTRGPGCPGTGVTRRGVSGRHATGFRHRLRQPLGADREDPRMGHRAGFSIRGFRDPCWSTTLRAMPRRRFSGRSPRVTRAGSRSCGNRYSVCSARNPRYPRVPRRGDRLHRRRRPGHASLARGPGGSSASVPVSPVLVVPSTRPWSLRSRHGSLLIGRST